jgi:TolB-like protein
VTDEVIADLGRNDWIAVFASATSARQAGATPQEVHAALGVDYVLTGTVQAEGERVRVSAALADASSGRQVWAESWEGGSDDLLALQVAASRALVGELAGRLHRRPRPRRPTAGARQDGEPRRLRPLSARDRAQAPLHRAGPP